MACTSCVVLVGERRVLHQVEVPVLRVVQVGEAAVDQRADEVQGERGALVAAQQQLGIGRAVGGREARAVDDVAAVGRQRDAVPRLEVGAARLGVLAGEAADADHRLLERRASSTRLICSRILSLLAMLSDVQSSKLSAQSPPWRRNALAALRPRRAALSASRSPRWSRSAAERSGDSPPSRARPGPCKRAAARPAASASSRDSSRSGCAPASYESARSFYGPRTIHSRAARPARAVSQIRAARCRAAARTARHAAPRSASDTRRLRPATANLRATRRASARAAPPPRGSAQRDPRPARWPRLSQRARAARR